MKGKILEKRINVKRKIWNIERNNLERKNIEVQLKLKRQINDTRILREENEIREELIFNLGNRIKELKKNYWKTITKGFYAEK